MTVHTYDTDENNITDDADTVAIVNGRMDQHETNYNHSDIEHLNRSILDEIIENSVSVDVPQCIISHDSSKITTNAVFDISSANLTDNKIDAGTKITARKDGEDKIYTFSEDINLGVLDANSTIYVALEIINDTPILTNSDVNIHLLSEGMHWKTLSSPLISKNDMTSNNDGGYIVSASTYHVTAPPYMAFDAILGAGWVTSNGGITGWIQQQLPTAKIICKYAVTGTSDSSRSPRDWTLEGSNNGTDWVVLDTVTGETGWGLSEKRSFEVNNTIAYTYYRLDISANNGNLGYLGVAELEFYSLIENSFYYDGNNCFIGNESEFENSVNAKRCIMFGELTTDTTEVTDIVTYAFNGQYDSDWFYTIVNTEYIKNHNIGTGVLSKPRLLFVDTISNKYPIDVHALIFTYGANKRGSQAIAGVLETRLRTGTHSLIPYHNFNPNTGAIRSGNITTGYLRILVKREDI